METKYVTYNFKLAKVGSKVLSHSDRKGNALEGVIFEINPSEIRVDYRGYGNVTLKHNGRLLSTLIDTSLDVGLVVVE